MAMLPAGGFNLFAYKLHVTYPITLSSMVLYETCCNTAHLKLNSTWRWRTALHCFQTLGIAAHWQFVCACTWNSYSSCSSHRELS